MWLATELGLRQSYTEPSAVYRLAKARGMTHVTLTDHDTIEGALRLAHHDDFIIGEEVAAFFPSEALHVHVLVWGIDEEHHGEIRGLRFNVFELVDYLRGQRIAHGLAHPFSIITGGLRAEQLESLLFLFDLWEVRDGLAARSENELAADVVARSATLRARLSGLGGGADRGRIGPFAGSNDHSGLDVGGTYTVLPLATEESSPLDALVRGEGAAAGSHGSTAKLAHTGVTLILKGGGAGSRLVRGAVRQATRSDLVWQLLERPRNRRLTWRALAIVSSQGGRRLGGRRSLTSTAIREASRGMRDTDAPAWGLRHEQIQALVESTWRAAMQDRLGASERLDIGTFFADPGRLKGIADAQSLLAPYLLAAGFHARQRRHAAEVERRLAARGLVRQPAAATLPRVAMFTDTFDEVNGVGTVLRELVGFAGANDWPLALVSAGPRRSSAPGREVFAAVESYWLDVYPGFPLALLPVLQVLRWCEETGIEVIHAATPGPVGMVAWLIASSLDLPFVATYHTDLPSLGYFLTGDRLVEESLWAYVRLFYDQCEVVFCPSQISHRQLAEHRVRTRLEPFPQGVDCDLFTPARRDESLREELGGGRSVLLWVGRISAEKGLDGLATSYATLRSRRDDARLVVVGDGPYRDRLEELAPEASFLGVRTGEELAAIYASADVFLFPGRAETFGQAVLEAAASGLPAVVSAGTGAEEAMVRDVTALSVAPGDQRGFVAAIERLLDDGDLRAEMSIATRRHALTRTWPGTFAHLGDAYRTLAW